MQASKNSKQITAGILGSIAAVCMVWTSICLYTYYTGPQFTIDSYINHLARKEYAALYEMMDKEKDFNSFTKEQIVNYYTKQYDTENNLVEISKRKNIVITKNPTSSKSKIAFCNIKYTFSNKEQTAALYLIKRGSEWKIKFPFILSGIKVYAPAGSNVYINGQKTTVYENDVYVQKDVLPGKYLVKVDFQNQELMPYTALINVPDEKEVILPYDALKVEVATIKNVVVELEGIKKASAEGVAVFNNILEGSYKLKVFSPNEYINPIEMAINVNKTHRQFSLFDVTLSEKGKEKLNTFINAFYNDYLKDIKGKKCESILSYISKEANGNITSDFKDWFINNKNICEAKIVVQPSEIRIDEQGLLHTSLLETVNLTNKEFDEDKNCNVNRKYKLILDWDTTIDISGENWQIKNKEIKQSMVSFEDSDGKWVQY